MEEEKKEDDPNPNINKQTNPKTSSSKQSNGTTTQQKQVKSKKNNFDDMFPTLKQEKQKKQSI